MSSPEPSLSVLAFIMKYPDLRMSYFLADLLYCCHLQSTDVLTRITELFLYRNIQALPLDIHWSTFQEGDLQAARQF